MIEINFKNMYGQPRLYMKISHKQKKAMSSMPIGIKNIFLQTGKQPRLWISVVP